MTHELRLPSEQDPLQSAGVRDDEGSTGGNRVFEIVFEEIRQRIRRGEWLPGERLPSITQLSKDLEVSTTSVREALRSLQSIGMVTIEHGRGVFVTGSRGASEVLPQLENLNTGLILALAETRRILEPELAALAAERGTEDELAEIERLALEMDEEARQGLDFVEPDVKFHRQIAQAARNPILFRMMESVNDLFLESRRVTSLEPGMTARAVRYHLLIADALRDRDAAQARLLMLAHMNDAMNSVLSIERQVKESGR